jgi:hypothetical protein
MSFTRSGVATSLILMFAGALYAQTPEERKTLVVPLPDEEILRPCEYRLLLPESSDREPYGQSSIEASYLGWYQTGKSGRLPVKCG